MDALALILAESQTARRYVSETMRACVDSIQLKRGQRAGAMEGFWLRLYLAVGHSPLVLFQEGEPVPLDHFVHRHVFVREHGIGRQICFGVRQGGVWACAAPGRS